MSNLPQFKSKRVQPVIKDPIRICTICSSEYKAVAPLQKTCSKECRKSKNTTSRHAFHAENPDKQKEYYKNAVKRDPTLNIKRKKRDREEIIALLGGKCCVSYCEVCNPLHLHADYVPTMKNTGYRHPRHRKWMIDNIKDFRLLCANHHYELTITGSIERTNIKQ